MKVIIIVDSPFPPNTGLTIRMYELARSLIRRGHKVYMISQGKSRKIINFDGIKVIQIGIRVKKNLFEHFSRFRYALKARKSIKTFGLSDADFVIGWNFFPNLAAHMISKKYGIRHICDMTDFGFDFFKASHPSIAWGPIAKFLEHMECRAIPRSSYRLVAVSDFMKNVLKKHYGINGEKINVINDGMYHDIKPNLPKENIRKKLGIGSEKVIFFLGNMDRHDGVDILFEAFRRMDRHGKKLVFVGGGRKYYREFKEMVGLSDTSKDVIFTGYVPRGEALNYISIADVGVIPFRRRLATDNVFTFKFFEYIALGVPIVCTEIETLSKLIKEKNSGEIVRCDDPESLRRGIEKVLGGGIKPNPSRFREFWWENLTRDYSILLERIR